MKISGSAPAAGPSRAASRSGGAASEGFAATSATSTSPSSAVTGPAVALGVAGLEALLALQEAGGPLERRRRAVARASRLLDGLDAVKLALLDGEDADAALQGLARAVAERRERVDEPALGDVLDEIETRAAVEIAKREALKRAA